KSSYRERAESDESSDLYPDLSNQIARLHITHPAPAALPPTTEPEAGPSTSVYVPPNVVSDYEDSTVEPPDPRFTKEKKDEINQLLALVKRRASYYEILGLPDFAGPDQINRAWKKLKLKFHWDKNGFPERERCEKIIDKAHRVLTNPHRKKEYDMKLKGKSTERSVSEDKVPVGEDFARNAWGRAHDEGEDIRKHEYFDDKPTRRPERQKIKKPSDLVRHFQEMGLKSVQALVCTQDPAQHEQARKDIARLNRKIRRAIANESLPDDTYTIKVDQLLPISKVIHDIGSYFRKDMAHVADSLSRGILLNFRSLCRRPENQWPDDWIDYVREAISVVYREAGRHFSMPEEEDLTALISQRAAARAKSTSVVKQPRRKQPRQDAQSIDAEGDIRMLDESDAEDDGLLDETDISFSEDSGDETTEASIPVNIRPGRGGEGMLDLVVPGRTLDNEKILGYVPWFGYTQDGKPWGVTFIVETGGRNPITWVSGTDIGDSVKDAYFRLPRDKWNEVKKKGTLRRKDMLDKIVGYACYAKPWLGTLPNGTV
ncbi:hypothetical protein NKR23_g12545, partial [Pleurostoma richardsiae]